MHAKRPCRSLALAAVAAPLVLVSCSDSATGPSADPTPTGPVVTGPALSDVPPVPVPASPGGNVPATSTIHTTIEPLEGDVDFNPGVSRAFAFWTLAERIFSGSWSYVGLGNQWSHDLTAPVAPSGLRSAPPPDPLNERILLIDGGSPVDTPRRIYETRIGPYTHRLVMDARTFDGDVYVKRERQRELDSFGGAGAFHLIEPNQWTGCGTLPEDVYVQ